MAVVSESPVNTEEHSSDARTYFFVWVALLVLTVLELAASVMDFLGAEISTIIILVFTLAKAVLVAGFFMHLFFEERKKFLVLTVFIVPVLIVIPIVFMDVILPTYF
ncbi:MAG: cytochrome C oxidase subunit IV family protein [Candidatus Hodarchaeales archaeon]|jgi:caa(3)-type oxidase subunit IV